MSTPLRLMGVLAHPDDETFTMGSTLVKYAAEGIETVLVMATRGERGWNGSAEAYPSREEVGRIRTAELLAAAEHLRVGRVEFLDYVDGELDQAAPAEVVEKIVGHLRRYRPDVVATFAPEGSYGHPDHIAISQATMAAIIQAASEDYRDAGGQAPHVVAKLYYVVDTRAELALFFAMGGDIAMTIDGVERRPVPWEDWAITTRVDGDGYWETALRALRCHVTQVTGLEAIVDGMAENHRVMIGVRSYYRAFSLVNGGRAGEDDLFAGLR